MAGAVFADGRVVLAGYTAGEDYLVVCFKADGSGVSWSATYDLAGGNDRAVAVVIDQNDDVIVTGQAWNGQNYDIHTVKYNGTTGAVSWQHTFDAGHNGSDYGRAVAVDALGNVYVAGISQGAAGDDDLILLKYQASGPTPDGNPLWQKTFDGGTNGNDGAVAVVAGTDFVAVAGYSHNGTDFDFRTIRYGLDGSLVWSTSLDSGSGNDQPVAIGADASGNVVVTGYVSNGGSTDIKTVSYAAADGALRWSRAYDGGYGDEPRALTVAGGEVYLTGFSYSLSGFNDFYTARLAGTTGAVVWEKTFDSGGGNGDIGLAVTVDASGDVFVAGYTQKFSADADFQTIKYAGGDGTMLWQRSFAGAAGKDDEAVAVGTASGGVLVGGWSDQWTGGAGDYDFFLVRYDAGLINAPSGLSATATSNTTVALAWQDNSSNEDGFAIWRDDGSGFTQVATVGANVTSYTDTGLTSHIWYTYKVKATSATIGDSQFTPSVEVLTTYLSYDPPSWVYTYNSSDGGDDFARDVAVDSNGNPIVTGSTTTVANGSYASEDYLTIKLDRTDASERWQAAYNDPDDEMDRAVSVAVASDDTVVVTGNSSLFGGSINTNDLFTRKYLATGPDDGPPNYGDPYVWDDAYNGPGDGDDRGVAVATSTGDNIGVTGYGRNASGNDDIYLLLYDAAGNRLWTATPYDGGGNDYPAAIAFDAAGNLYLAGKAHNGSDYDLLLRRYNEADGGAAWTVRADIAGGNDGLVDVAVLDSGDIVAAGTVTNSTGDTDIRLARYSATSGTLAWSQDYDGPAGGDDTAVAVGIDRLRDEILVLGTRLTGAGNHDFHLRRYDTSGALVWERTLERTSTEDYATALSVDISGNACVAGYSVESGNDNVITVCYDAEGNLVGSGRYAGAAGGDDRAAALAANRFGEVYLAGFTTNASSNADYLVFRVPASVISVPTEFAAASLYTTVTLSWTDNSLDEDAFHLERKNGACSGSATWSRIADTAANTTSFADSNLEIGATYCYRIRSHNAAGLISAWVELETSTAEPPPPSGLTGTAASSTVIDLTWTDNTTGESEFLIERCQGAGCTDFTALATVAADTTSYTDDSVCEGTTYSYRVLARKSGVWVSGYSNVAADVTTPSKATPGSFTASRVSEGEIRLTWIDTTADESGFTIERCEGAGCDFSSVVTIGIAANSSAWNDTDSLAPDTTYRYRIQSYKTASCSWQSAFSAPAEATTTLLAPSGLTATATDTTTVDLAWTDNTGFETGFTIERCAGAGCDFSTSTTFTVAADTTSYTDDTACQGTTYRYRVKATNPSWSTGYSNVAEASTAAASAPTLTTASRQDEETISLAWTDTTTDESGFEIERCEGAGCDFSTATTLDAGADSTTLVDQGLTPDTLYRYRVRAVKSASCAWTGPWSSVQEATTTLLAPSSLTAVAADTTTVDLAWTDNTGNETGFEVERCQGDGCSSFTLLSRAAVGASSASDATVCQDTTYSYRVRAVNEGLSNAMGGCWSRRAPLAFTGFTANALVRFSVTYDADMQADFDDLRFYDETDGKELAYWIERKTDGASAVIWLKTGDNDTVNMYYGNPQATAGSDQDAIFLFADAFLGTTLDTDKWIEIDPDEAIRQDNGLRLSYVNYAWSRALISNQTFARQPGRTIYMRLRPEDGPASDLLMTGWRYDETTSANYNTLMHALYWNNGSFAVYEYGQWRGYASYTSYAWNTPYDAKLILKATGATYYVRGGAYSSWRLINDLAVYNTTPLRVGLSQNSHQASLFFIGVTDLSIPDMSAGVGAEEQSGSCFTIANTWTSSFSATASLTLPAALPPSGLTLTAASESEIDLLWTDNTSDETGFRVQRCQGSGCTGFATIATLAADETSYHDTGLTQSTTYTYRIEAFKSADCAWTAASSPAEATTLAPPAPSGLTATATDTTTVDLSWTDNTGTETGFIVERCQGSGCTSFSQLAVTAADATSYTDGDACPATTYTYRVKATNDAVPWTSAASDTAEATTASLPAAPSLNASRASEVAVDLSWTDTASDETGYRVERCQGSGCTDFAEIAVTTADAVSHTDSGLTPATTYRYRLRPYKNSACAWNGPYSPASGDVTTTILPPADVSATATNTTTVTLSWTDTTASETGFEVERCQGSGCADFASLATAAADSTTYQDTTAAHSTTYRYRIRAIGSGWASSYTATGDVTTPTPSPPSDLAVNRQSETTLSLSWTDNTSDESGFEIERCQGSGCTGFALLTTTAANATSYLDSGLAANTTYRYRVRAVKTATAPWQTAYTAPDEAATTVLAPTLASPLTPDTTTVDLSWTDNTVSETGFELERCLGSGCADFALLTTLAADTTAYTDTSVCAGQIYRYRLRAVKSSAWNSPYDTSADISLPAPTAPASLVAVSSAEDSVSLTWSDTTADETGFAIERCTGASCADFLALAGTAANATSYVDAGLSPSTTYCYRVQAVKTADCPWASAYSATACDRTMPATPTDLTATPLDSMRIQLSWTDNATDEDSYRIEEKVWNGRWVTLDTVAGDVTTYTCHLGIEAEKTYTYRVRAVRNTTDLSAPSNEASATTPAFDTSDTTCR